MQGIDTINYLDDFGGADDWVTAHLSFEGLGKVLQFAGIAEAPEKACAPATVMTFLGLQFDTVEFTLTITPDRLVEIQAPLASWEGKVKANRLELQSLSGKLQFAAGCVRPVRIFVSRLLIFLRTTKESVFFLIPPDARADIAWWQKFMPTYNRVSMMPWNEWSQPDEVVSTDACLSGCSGWVHGEFFHAQFPANILTQNFALRLWGPL